MLKLNIADNIKTNLTPLIGTDFLNSPPVENFIENITEYTYDIIYNMGPNISNLNAEQLKNLILTCAETAKRTFSEGASDGNWLNASYHLYKAYEATKQRKEN